MTTLVAIDLPGGPGFVDVLRAQWEQGHAVLPVDQRLSQVAKTALMEALGAQRVVSEEGLTDLPQPTPPDRSVLVSGDALVMATSGTTGQPKGVVLTHQAIEASALSTAGAVGAESGVHRWLACLPLSHIGGFSVLTKAIYSGCALEVHPGFSAKAALAASGPQVLVSLVPTALARVGAEHWHTVILGGSAPPSGLAPNVLATYGMTETGSGVVYDGMPLPGVEIRVVGASSEIQVRAPMLLRCYTDGSVPLDAQGWLSTGDSGTIGQDGRLSVDGRLSEMIITGGENVWPTPVERILAACPGVGEVAVAGVDDPEWGQRVVAWVVPVPDGDLPQLQQMREAVKTQLASYAAPKELVLVDSLPKTSLGKIRRGLLPQGFGPLS